MELFAEYLKTQITYLKAKTAYFATATKESQHIIQNFSAISDVIDCSPYIEVAHLESLIEAYTEIFVNCQPTPAQLDKWLKINVPAASELTSWDALVDRSADSQIQRR